MSSEVLKCFIVCLQTYMLVNCDLTHLKINIWIDIYLNQLKQVGQTFNSNSKADKNHFLLSHNPYCSIFATIILFKMNNKDWSFCSFCYFFCRCLWKGFHCTHEYDHDSMVISLYHMNYQTWIEIKYV